MTNNVRNDGVLVGFCFDEEHVSTLSVDYLKRIKFKDGIKPSASDVWSIEVSEVDPSTVHSFCHVSVGLT